MYIPPIDFLTLQRKRVKIAIPTLFMRADFLAKLIVGPCNSLQNIGYLRSTGGEHRKSCQVRDKASVYLKTILGVHVLMSLLMLVFGCCFSIKLARQTIATGVPLSMNLTDVAPTCNGGAAAHVLLAPG